MIKDINLHIHNERAGKIPTKLRKNKLIINVWDVLNNYDQSEIDMGIPIELEVSIDG